VAFFKLLLWNLPRETEKYHEEESVTWPWFQPNPPPHWRNKSTASPLYQPLQRSPEN
jgi:hypothetical protein